MNEKEIEKLIKKSAVEASKETRHENAILIEDMRSNFKMFGEVLDHVREKGDSTFEEVGKIKLELSEINNRLGNIETEVKSLRKDFDLARETGDIGFMRDIKDRLVVVEKRLGLNLA